MINFDHVSERLVDWLLGIGGTIGGIGWHIKPLLMQASTKGILWDSWQSFLSFAVHALIGGFFSLLGGKAVWWCIQKFRNKRLRRRLYEKSEKEKDAKTD